MSALGVLALTLIAQSSAQEMSAQLASAGAAKFSGAIALKKTGKTTELVLAIANADPGLYAIGVSPDGNCSRFAALEDDGTFFAPALDDGGAFFTLAQATGGTSGQQIDNPGGTRGTGGTGGQIFGRPSGTRFGPSTPNAPTGRPELLPGTVAVPAVPLGTTGTRTATIASPVGRVPAMPPSAVFSPRVRARTATRTSTIATPPRVAMTPPPPPSLPRAEVPMVPDVPPDDGAPTDRPEPTLPGPSGRGSPSHPGEVSVIGYVLVGTDGRGYLETKLALKDAGAATFDALVEHSVIVQRSPIRGGDPAAYDVVACGTLSMSSVPPVASL